MRTTIGSGIGGNRGRRRIRERQREQERDAAFGQVVRPDAAAVRLDDSSADRETEPRASPALRGGPVELLEDERLLPLGKPGTVVRDLRGQALVRRGHDDADGAVGWRVLDSVVQQVEEDLLDEDVVDLD